MILGTIMINRRYNLFTKTSRILLIFLTWILLSGLWSTYSEAVYMKIILSFMNIGFVLLIITKPYSIKEYKKIELSALLGFILMMIIFFLVGDNYYGDTVSDRISITDASDPNHLLMSQLYGFSIMFNILLDTGKKYIKLINTFGVVMFIYMLIASGARGALIATLVMVMFSFWQRKQYKFMVLLLLITCVFIVYIGEIIPRYALEFALETGGAGRVDIWIVALEMIKDNFFLGIGIGSFQEIYNVYASFTEIGFSRHAFRVAHNTIIEVMSELGIIGLGIYISLIYIIIKDSVKLKNYRSLISGLIGIIVAMFFLTAFESKIFWFIMALCIASYDTNEVIISNDINKSR